MLEKSAHLLNTKDKTWKYFIPLKKGIQLVCLILALNYNCFIKLIRKIDYIYYVYASAKSLILEQIENIQNWNEELVNSWSNILEGLINKILSVYFTKKNSLL